MDNFSENRGVNVANLLIYLLVWLGLLTYR